MSPSFIILSGREKYWKTFLTKLYTISASNFCNCIIISNVVKCKPDRMPLNVSLSIFLWKVGVPFREKNIKLLYTWKCRLHSYNRNSILHFIAEAVIHCRKYHLHNCNRDSHLLKYNKNCHPHIPCRNCHLHKCCRNF